VPTIHFVERKNNVRRMPDAPGEWESGYWVVSEESAHRLVGGDLYLHSGQNEPSHSLVEGSCLTACIAIRLEPRSRAESSFVSKQLRSTRASVQGGRDGEMKRRSSGKGCLSSNRSFDTDAQGRPPLRGSCSLVAGQLQR
jgi:hypothetical protein